MHNIFSVVNFIIKTSTGVTNLKLQKVLYYLQLFHLGKYGKPLFENVIEAWSYGPVIPEVYYAFKHYEGDIIRFILPQYDYELDEETKNFITKQLRLMDKYSPQELVDLTRKVGTPWSTIWGKGEGRFGIIPTNLMLNYYNSITK